ncbi:hypothetical protein [Vannielia litorea]|uniref:hypothetical protein n=1 Tax=Vannielia litorea TaxID=1217970 RepID=UPI001BCCB93D|nr:hypothetical protein [Vannielia litorea]MBS8228419.1 hypothetical protein [Vannielia litorea]
MVAPVSGRVEGPHPVREAAIVINIGDNIAAFERQMSDFARSQLPFATAMALNDTAADVKDAEETELAKALDRPTPFTRRGLFVSRASKRKLTAIVGFKDIQAAYLALQVEGGRRSPKGRAILVPVGQRLNKYGNMPRGAVARMLKRPDVFVASKSDPKTKHLRPGIYQRNSRKGRRNAAPNLLVAFEDEAQYRPRLRFDHVAERRALARIERNFLRRLEQALATAR